MEGERERWKATQRGHEDPRENSDRVGRVSRALEAGAGRQRGVRRGVEEGGVGSRDSPLLLGSRVSFARILVVQSSRLPVFTSILSLAAQGRVGNLPVGLFFAPPLDSVPANSSSGTHPPFLSNVCFDFNI